MAMDITQTQNLSFHSTMLTTGSINGTLWQVKYRQVEQWGNNANNDSDVAYFPITFSTVYCVVGVRYTKSGNCGVHSFNTSSVTFGYWSNIYIAVGR